MIILSNCMMDVVDEGCLKVANSLVKRIKAAAGATVISYERSSALTDIRLELNKFLLNRKLVKLLSDHREEPLLYIPFPAKPISMAIRTFILSCFCRGRLSVLLTMNVPMGAIERLLYRLTGAVIYVLSEDSREMMEQAVGAQRVVRLKMGVDTRKFQPVSEQTKQELKRKYGFDAAKPVVLHVGHLNRGRNVEQLMKIDPRYQVLLVTSTLTRDEQDTSLRAQLLERENIRIFSEYLPQIQEIYQLADVYFFPVRELGRCIDVPLSCLEAASCNTPVVTTDFGEMKAFRGKNGFFYLESFDESSLNEALKNAMNMQAVCTRDAVMDYDWSGALKLLTIELE